VWEQMTPKEAPPVIPFDLARTVLVVDDEEIIRRTAGAILRHAGYNVLEAENGRKALELLQRDPAAIDAVLLDVSMPVMGGEAAVIRMREIKSDLRIMVSSGLNETDVGDQFRYLGVAGFVQKPYNVKTLTTAIRELFERAKSGGAA